MNTTFQAPVDPSDTSTSIAIIGMAGRFPGANTLEAFWYNLQHGIESITVFSDQQLREAGVSPSLINNPDYVKASPILTDFDKFDAFFFDYSANEALYMDPQQRVFLECAWQALESAGYSTGSNDQVIGVYGGSTLSIYLLNNILNHHTEPCHLTSSKEAMIFGGNVPESLATRVAYKLNLTGPAVHISTACSTSLVTVHSACQSLLNGECDIALAGGVSYLGSQTTGYLPEEGMMLSLDGHCRSFDAKGTGTLWGNGVGLVVLKLLDEAVADGDTIHAVVKGSAINNDGNLKVSHSAPSVDAQANVIYQAQDIAEIDPQTISYIEAHGTATPLGDPIEIAALTQAFSAGTQSKQYCAIGSLKSNIGHLSEAAGIAGLIKTVLMLKHKHIPPSLNFDQPNPQIDFANSPFYVNTQLKPWDSKGYPRRAGVSSFGVGGTNAHIVLEEWDAPSTSPTSPTPSTQGKAQQLLLVSAKTASALKTATANLANHLQRHPELNLNDVAFTLAMGRRAFNHRYAVTVSESADAIASLQNPADLSPTASVKERSVVFMFPGQGSQYVNMAQDLYQTETVFRQQLDKCCELLHPHLGQDLRDILYPTAAQMATASETLKQTSLTQAALFVIEYALAQQWMAWGVKPAALIGHSIGEYVAATLANVLTLEDALAVVAARGMLMQSMPTGSMMAISASRSTVEALITEISVTIPVAIAVVNSPTSCVVSGTDEAIGAIEEVFTSKAIPVTRLQTSHAFHSPMMEPILQAFTDKVRQVTLNKPEIAYISNVTGTWITDEQATDANYYAEQLLSCVNFSDGIKHCFVDSNQILLEVGPGHTLSAFAKRHPDKHAEQIILSSMPSHQQDVQDTRFLLQSLGRLWVAGIPIDWQYYYQDQQDPEQKNYRVELPTYPFEHQSFWKEPTKINSIGNSDTVADQTKQPLERWFYQPSWQRANLPFTQQQHDHSPVLVFVDQCGYGTELVKQLATTCEHIVTVNASTAYIQSDDSVYRIDPDDPEHYQRLIAALHSQDLLPKTIVHLWGVTDNNAAALNLETLDATQNQGFYSLLYLAQALGQQNIEHQTELLVVTNQLQNVTGDETIMPEKATAIGAIRVIPQEYNNIHCRSIDIAAVDAKQPICEKVISQLLSEFKQHNDDQFIAYRGNSRWLATYEPVQLDSVSSSSESLHALPLTQAGVYLITGGMGGMGLVFAEYLAKTQQANLILTGRSPLPKRDDWAHWLATHVEADPTSKKIRKIQQFEQWGAKVLAVSVDVTNQQQMAEAIAQGQQQFGQINGVIHTAGIAGGGVIQIKTKQAANQVLAPKVAGTLILDNLFKEIPLDFMVLCSSLEATLGTAGQVDYCAANNFLDAYAHSKATDSTRTTLSINWDAWQEVGMAVDTAEFGLDNKILEIKKLDHHLFEQCIVEQNQVTYLSTLKPDTHWIIGEHLVLNTPSLVGTAYLEIARAAFECYSGHSTMELQDVYFLKFLFVEPDEEKDVRTILKFKQQAVEFSIQSYDPDSGEWSVNAQGRIVTLDKPKHVAFNLSELEKGCDQEIKVPDLQALPDYTNYGSRWLNNIKWRKDSEENNLALMELPAEFHRDLDHYKFHPSLVDTATYVVADVLPNELTGKLDFFNENSAYLPYFYEKVIIKGPLPAKFYSYTNRTLQERNWSINLSFLDTEGNELVAIENYILKYIDSAYTLKEDQKETTVKKSQAHKPQQSLDAAILPQEGVDCLARILQSRVPQVLVSTMDFQTQLNLLHQTSTDSPEQAVELFERPLLNEAYLTPTTETEKAIALVWEHVMGIKDIGANDNFFDLGGDSLIMVQVLLELRQKVRSDLTMNALLRANTIAELAQIIEPSKTDNEALPACLVKFREGDNNQPALFLIHPIAGNSFNYINLPSCMPTEQAIYALQHPYWTDETREFDTIEQIASYYLEAIQKVQPKGPYRICGYSGGVYIAYDIAQQINQMNGEVEFLALIDKSHWAEETDKPNWNNVDFGTDLETFVYYADLRTPKSNGESHLSDYQKLATVDQQLRYFIDNSPWLQGMMPQGTSFEGWRQFWRIFVKLRIMNVNYQPKTYRAGAGEGNTNNSNAVYFAAEIRETHAIEFCDQAWFKLIPELKLEVVPGDHVSIWHQPNVQVLAQKMQSYFRQPQTRDKSNYLTKTSLFEAAYDKTGLNDLGSQGFQAGLDKLLESINQEAHLHSTGQQLIAQHIMRLLVNRLHMQDDFKRHPEILQTPVKQPLFIIGLPRTGSTYLHNILSKDSANRPLHLWEAFSPSPPPDPLTLTTDPRIKKAQDSFSIYEKFSPESSAMHKYDACAPEECHWLLQHDFTSVSFSFLAEMPAYTQWLKTQDMVPVYEYYRQQLQLLSWKWRADRWVLKNPFHTADLAALRAVFPDAQFIQIHRDPLEVTASYSSLVEKLRPAYADEINRHALGKEVLGMLAYQIERGMTALADIPDSQVCNIRFSDLVDDPMATVKQIYDHFGYQIVPETQSNMSEYIKDNPRYKHGEYSYSLEQFGLTSNEVKQAFAQYLTQYEALL